MSGWGIANSAVSAVVVATALTMLIMFKPRYTLLERLGLALIAGAGFLRVHVVLTLKESPYWDWAPTFMIIGVSLFLAGRGWRDWRHELANRRMLKQAEKWQRGKGA